MYINNKPVIKIDCDGVLRDLLPKMIEVYNDAYHTNLTEEDIKYFDVSKVFTKCMEVDNIPAHIWLFQKNGYELFMKSPVLKGAKEAMDLLHEKGYYIVIVTYQHSLDNKVDTLLWLDKHNIYYDSICFTNQKQIINGEIVVDDNIDYLNQCNESLKVCIKAPYNINNNTYKKYKSLYEYATNAPLVP